MLVRYWPVTVQPTPLSVTRIGVGVIAMDMVTREVRAEIPGHWDSLLESVGASSGVLSGVKSFAKELSRSTERQDSLQLDPMMYSTGMLKHVSEHWNNAVRIEDSRIMHAESFEEGIDSIYRTVIGTPRRTTRQRKVAQVKRKVLDEYGKIPEVARLVHKAPVLHTEQLDRAMDLAVCGEEQVFELNTAFSFHQQDLTNLENKIDAWNWRIEKLRHGGGSLELSKESRVHLPGDVPVVATYWEPSSKEQVATLQRTLEKWDSLNVTAVERHHVEQHATSLLERVVA